MQHNAIYSNFSVSSQTLSSNISDFYNLYMLDGTMDCFLIYTWQVYCYFYIM